MTFKEGYWSKNKSLRGVKRRSNPVKGLIRKIKTEIVYIICGLPRRLKSSRNDFERALTFNMSLRGAKRRSNPVKIVYKNFITKI